LRPFPQPTFDRSSFSGLPADRQAYEKARNPRDKPSRVNEPNAAWRLEPGCAARDGAQGGHSAAALPSTFIIILTFAQWFSQTPWREFVAKPPGGLEAVVLNPAFRIRNPNTRLCPRGDFGFGAASPYPAF
jgi:hypothetical protein